MSIIWNSKDAAKATGGKSTKEWNASGISIDSRTIAKGDIFVALKGENFDGHDFVIQSLDKGAVVAVINEEQAKKYPSDKSLLIVKDTMQGLWDLGKFSRERTKAKIIGVTGSVGKTSTKEMIAIVLGDAGKTYATVGNLNNHFGAPLSLSRLLLITIMVYLKWG